METRGQRNNNPLNIRLSSDRWQGMSERQTDKAFVQFVSVNYGIRAALIIIRSYINKYNCNTIASIVARWAPPCENNTKRYIQYVSDATAIRPHTTIRWSDRTWICAIVKAMAKYESNMIINIDNVKNVYDILA